MGLNELLCASMTALLIYSVAALVTDLDVGPFYLACEGVTLFVIYAIVLSLFGIGVYPFGIIAW